MINYFQKHIEKKHWASVGDAQTQCCRKNFDGKEVNFFDGRENEVEEFTKWAGQFICPKTKEIEGEIS